MHLLVAKKVFKCLLVLLEKNILHNNTKISIYTLYSEQYADLEIQDIYSIAFITQINQYRLMQN